MFNYICLGMIERWETLASRVDQAQTAGTLQRALATMRTRFKAIHDRLFDYEIVLEPHLLDDRINRIAVSCSSSIIYILFHIYVYWLGSDCYIKVTYNF